MSVEQSQMWCPRCNSHTLAQRPGASHLLHLVLTVLTVGLWLPVWILCAVRIGGWRCQQCGGTTTAGGIAQKFVSAIMLIGLLVIGLMLAAVWGFIPEVR